MGLLFSEQRASSHDYSSYEGKWNTERRARRPPVTSDIDTIPKIPAFLKLPAVFLDNTDSFSKSLRSEYCSFSIRATRRKKLTDRLQERVLSPETIVRAATELSRKTQSGRAASKRKFAETLRPRNGPRLKYIRFTFLPALSPLAPTTRESPFSFLRRDSEGLRLHPRHRIRSARSVSEADKAFDRPCLPAGLIYTLRF